MKFYFLLFIALLTAVDIYSQESKFGIAFSGFVRTDFTYDSRQTVSLRDGNIMMYPADKVLTVDGSDKNANPNFNILSIDTRLTVKIIAPDFLGAKTSGLMEGEFFGTTDGDINGFRLRHAYLKLDWENTSLLAGQTWNPMFIPECSPDVVSFNTGVPFQPLARNPQIRLTQKFGDVYLSAALLSERDYTDDGPVSFSTSYLRNSGIPETHLQLQYKPGKNVFGIGGEVKVIQPQLSTAMNYETNEKVTSYAGMGYCKLIFEKFKIMIEGVYGQNMTDVLMIGGYAVKTYDTSKAIQTYLPLNIGSVWTDISYGENLSGGLFAGYTKNLGASENTYNKFYGRGYNIDNVIRIAPRISYTSGKTTLAAELEFTSADYGTNNSLDKAKIINLKSVSNLRSLICFIYRF